MPNRLMAEYYAQRSAAGSLVTAATAISEEANEWDESAGIYTHELTQWWRCITDAVHEGCGAILGYAHDTPT